MNSKFLSGLSLCRAAWCIFLLLSSLPSFPQGSLTSPGAPAPTMKSLDQFASTGIAINATNTPGDASNHFVIELGRQLLSHRQSGSQPKTNGIHVTAAGVPSISMDSRFRALQAPRAGIAIDAAAHRTAPIKIESFSGVFQQAVLCSIQSRGGAMLDLVVSGVAGGGGGNALSAGTGYVIERCRVHDCPSGDAAIFAQSGSTLSHCTVYGNTVPTGIAASEGCSHHCAAFANTSSSSFSVGINAGSEAAARLHFEEQYHQQRHTRFQYRHR